MKKKNILKKIFSLILLAPMFLFTGCSGGGDGGGLEVPDPDGSGLPIGVDFDGFTHTYNGYPFKGAYVFVDPGSQGIFTDGYDGDRDATFAGLVERQYETLAKEITYRLFSVYGNEEIVVPEENKQIDFGSTSHKVDVAKNQIIDDKVTVLEVPTLSLSGENATTTWSYLLGLTDTTIAEGEGNILRDIKANNPFNLTNSFAGGYKPVVMSSKIDFSGALVGDASWVLNLSLTEHLVNIEQIILQKLLEAVVGETGSKETLIDSIDHLGFVGEDYDRILNCVNQNIIGETAIQYDAESKNSLTNTLQYTLTTLSQKYNTEPDMDPNVITIENVNNLDINYCYWLKNDPASLFKTFNSSIGADGSSENNTWLRAHEYKGYDVIVPSIVKSAMGVTIDETDGLTVINKEVSEGVNIYSTLPRAQVLYMDIYTLQGTSKEEVENSQQESENPTNGSNEELGDAESTYDPETDYVKLEKYLPDMNIISIVLLPNEITGNPNKMVDGEIVPDTTVTVNGFLLGSIDFAISGEDGYNSTIYADFELKAKGNYIKNGEHNFRSDSVEIYGDRIPENDDEAAFNVYTDLLPLDELKEDINKKNDYLIGGYNGSLVEDYGLKGTKSTTENGGEYTIYNLKTNTDFIGYGANGVFFDGGDNYVKVNFIFAEIFSDEDVGKNENLVDIKVNTLLNILAFNPEVL